MKRFFENAGLALVYIVTGAMVSFFVYWVGFKLFSIGYELINGYPFHARKLTIERIRISVVFVVWALTTSWLFWKKRRIDYRWNSEGYLNCLRCGYNLRHSQDDKCPECGYKLPPHQIRGRGRKGVREERGRPHK